MSEMDDVDRIKANLPPLEHLAEPKYATRHGDELQGAHPIHGGTNHSDAESNNFSVNTKDQVWNCFAHGTGGDVLAWIAVEEGILDCSDASKESVRSNFPEILEVAANKAGIELDMTEEERKRYKEAKEERQRLTDAFKVAQNYFKSNLTPDAREWVKEKYGFTDEQIDEFGIGYAPPSEDGLKKRLEKKCEEYAYSSGLLLRYNNGYVDFFQGRVTFPYYNHGDIVYFIGRKTPWTPDDKWQKGKYLKQMVGDKHEYISDQTKNHLYGLDTIRGEEKILVTEGITDAISAIIMGYPTVSPVTVKFNKEDIEKLKPRVKGKEVYVCNDADDAGLKGALDTVEEINNTHLVELDEGDLNDFFKDSTPEEFEELMDDALPRNDALAKYRSDPEYLFIASLEENMVNPHRVRKIWNNEDNLYEFKGIWEILNGVDDLERCISVFRRTEKTDFRTPTAVEKSLRKNIIAGVVLRDMKHEGKFLYEESTEVVYYFHEESHNVFNLQSPDSRGYLSRNYGINASTTMGEFVFEGLKTYGECEGEMVNVRKYFYYDEEEGKLFIHDKNSGVFVLDGESIEKEPNGENVYFETLHQNKIEYIPPEERDLPDDVFGQIDEWKDEGSFLHQVMLNRTNFAPKTALSAKQQRLQFLVTLYMFPFNTWFNTKPIMAFVGEKGSGKTLTMRMLGRLLTNPEYEITIMPDEGDFYVAAYNNPLYFLDNVDKSEKWLNDALASIATGASIKERQLYTNFEQAEAEINCFLGVNSRTPKFKRDDVVDRLLIFYVDRIDENIAPQALLGPIKENWSLLWSEYMDDLNKIVKIMNETELGQITSEHRLVEWVVFARLVQKALHIDEEKIEDLIRDMKHEKSAFALQDDPLLTALRNLLDSTLYQDKWYSAKELHQRLSEVDDVYKDSYNSFQSLSRRLPNVHPELNDILGMKQRYSKHEKHNEYRFGDPDATLDGFEEEEEEDQMSVEGDLGDVEENSSLDVEYSDKTLKTQIINTLQEGAKHIDAIIDEVGGYDHDAILDKVIEMKSNGHIYEKETDLYNLT